MKHLWLSLALLLCWVPVCAATPSLAPGSQPNIWILTTQSGDTVEMDLATGSVFQVVNVGSPTPTPTHTPTVTPTPATPTPSPTPTSTPVPGQVMLPQGIIYLTDYDSTNQPPSSVITAPYVDGATLRLRWKTLEPTEGVFNWTTLDAGLAKVAAAGKHAQLLIAAGQQSPSWLAAAGVPYYAPGTVNAVPVPWDPTFQAKLGRFIASLGAHIAVTGQMALVQGVVATGIAQTTSETKLCSSGTSSCVTDTAGWQAVGYSRDNVKSAFGAILKMWVTAFPSAGVSNRYTFDAFPQGFGGNIPDDMFPRELSNAGHLAYPSQYIMGYNGLDATTGISKGAGPGNLLPQMCPVGRTPNNLWGDCQPNQDVGFFEGLQENLPETSTFAGEWSQASNNLSHLLFIEVYPQGFTAANAGGLIAAHNALTGGSVPTPTPTSTPTNTPSPTPTPTPTPSPTGTPTPTATPSPSPTPTSTPSATPTPVAGAHYSNMVAVIEENTDYKSVFPTVCQPGSCTSTTMPNLANLINNPPAGSNAAMANAFFAVAHPSAINYLSMWGATLGPAENCSASSTCANAGDGVSGCFPSFPAGPWNGNQTGHKITEDDVSNELRLASMTWKAYGEGFMSINSCAGGALFAARHFPPINFADVSTNQPANAVAFPQFATDVANNALPNFSLVVPNTCDDAHDGGANCGLPHADAWLQSNVIAPLFGPNGPAAFKPGGKGVFVLTFDEDNSCAPGTNCPANPEIAGGGHIVFALVGPAVRAGSTNTIQYQFPSFTRLVLEGLGVTQFPNAAATAPSMSGFLQ